MYYQLVNQLRMLYPEYRYSIVPIVTGALGTIPQVLEGNLRKIFQYEEEKLDNIVKKLQFKAMIGTVNIVKTFAKIYRL